MDLSLATVIVLAILVVAVLLISRRKDKYQQVLRALFTPSPFMDADPRGFGTWWAGDGFVEQRVEHAITTDKEHYTHKRGGGYRYRRQPRRHKRH